MLDLFSNRFGWLLGPTLAALLWLLRAAARDPALRADLKASILSFGGYVAIFGTAELLDAAKLPKLGEYARVGSSLLFALGSIQAAAGIAHWGLRSRRGLVTPKILRDVVELGLFLVAVALILHHALNIDLGGLLATSAALSVVVGLALQETLGNLFAGLVLQVEPPFSVGDWVSVAGHAGQVVQVAWRGTKIVTLRREEITIPNGVIAKESVVNFSRSKLGIARDSDSASRLRLGAQCRARRLSRSPAVPPQGSRRAAPRLPGQGFRGLWHRVSGSVLRRGLRRPRRGRRLGVLAALVSPAARGVFHPVPHPRRPLHESDLALPGAADRRPRRPPRGHRFPFAPGRYRHPAARAALVAPGIRRRRDHHPPGRGGRQPLSHRLGRGVGPYRRGRRGRAPVSRQFLRRDVAPHR